MSQNVRQNNLFAAEDWETAYKSFKNVDFRAYDFDSLKQSMIEYLQAYYPEDFNDYIESSEYIALIELLAWLGTSLAFRVDLNSRENFLDTAERRESVIRLARMLSYQPKRNIGCKGLFKIVGVQTTQPLTDSIGRSLQNTTVFWDDPNNPDSFDQFTQIMNAVFIGSNPFGRPVKDGTIGGIRSSLYQLNNVPGLEVAYPLNVTVNTESMPFEIVNPDFNDGETFFERDPDPANAFHFIYRNDGQGISSTNTGFFVQFKQGTLDRVDEQFDFPKQNRIFDVTNIQNINNSDVWVQEINQSGDVLDKWTQVPALTGNNIAYNSINQDVRNIYSVISDLNDTIKIKFSDGNLGEVPTGTFRAWVRSSINKSFILRTDDARDLEITIPYVGSDNQEYQLRIIFQLEENVSNASPSETNEDIKENAPRVFYTQDRMVNNQDYNVYPLTYGNEIAKLKTINRTHSGHSRFIDINDPTGVHSDVILFAEDGALYKDNTSQSVTISTEGTIDPVASSLNQIQNHINDNQQLINWFYDAYIKEYQNKTTVVDGQYVFNIPKGRAAGSTANSVYFKTMPDRFKNDSGYITNTPSQPELGVVAIGQAGSDYEFMDEGSWVQFQDGVSTGLKLLVDDGVPPVIDDLANGPVEFTKEIDDLAPVERVLPPFRTAMNDAERTALSSIIENPSIDKFSMVYDINDGGVWKMYVPGVSGSFPTTSDPFTLTTNGAGVAVTNEQSWMLIFERVVDGNVGEYNYTTRATDYVFESYKQVRFFYDPNQKIFDPDTGKTFQDEINILKKINIAPDGSTPLPEDLVFQIEDVFIMDDGHQDQTKVIVKPADIDSDGIAEVPDVFDDYVGPPNNGTVSPFMNLDNHVFFAKENDTDGYGYFRPVAGSFLDLRGQDVTAFVAWNAMASADLIIVTNGDVPDLIANTDANAPVDIRENLIGKVIYEELAVSGGVVEELIPSQGFYNIVDEQDDGSGVIIIGYVSNTEDYRVYIGRGGFGDTTDGVDSMYFKWKHYAPSDNRIDPSVSNIMDMVILTQSYYSDVLVWKDEGKSLLELEEPPTTEELRVQFSDLNTYKMMSDQIVFQPAKFKILFGSQAEDELQATFKVVKIPTSTLNDNQIKAEVVNAINEYFDIANWDFGESFYYTELAAYIHQKLATSISSVVIVPTKSTSAFGNLFQIKAEPTELFLSTAGVNNVEIVANLTETNLRIQDGR